MNKRVMIGAGFALAAYLVLRESQNLKTTVAGLTVSFLPGGWPALRNGKVVFPIAVQVKNPGTRSLPLDSLRVNLHRVTDTGSYLVASTPAAGVTLPAIEAGKTTRFAVELECGLLDAVSELTTTFQKRGFNKFRVESTVRALGFDVKLPNYLYTL